MGRWLRDGVAKQLTMQPAAAAVNGESEPRAPAIACNPGPLVLRQATRAAQLGAGLGHRLTPERRGAGLLPDGSLGVPDNFTVRLTCAAALPSPKGKSRSTGRQPPKGPARVSYRRPQPSAGNSRMTPTSLWLTLTTHWQAVGGNQEGVTTAGQKSRDQSHWTFLRFYVSRVFAKSTIPAGSALHK